MSVTVILPTLNEASYIATAIRAVRALGPCEIIVVDGGSTDRTRVLARQADRVLASRPGRSFQMNAGAAAATGDCLLFLHADCRLQAGALTAVERTLARQWVRAGCFSMRVLAEGWGFRAIDASATARVRFTGIVYGDQGLFLRRREFELLGGFPPLRFMEDVFFSRMLARRGRVVVAPIRIYVSPRRWQKVGLIRQTLRNWTLTARALTGSDPDKLAQFYPEIR